MSNPISEGEQLISDFFEEQGIDAVPHKIISGLKDDNKEYREADFYLPRYDVYAEFLGRGHKSPEDKLRYKQKMAVYQKNNIPCIYLWPDNLGALDWG